MKLYIALIIPVLFSCTKSEKPINSFFDKPLKSKETIILLHKGQNFIYADLESSIDSLINSLDGIEVDVVTSLNGTLWLRHDDFYLQNSDTLNICDLNDEGIITQKLATHKLYDFLESLSKINPNFHISIDLKYTHTNRINNNDIATESSKKILKMVEKFHLTNIKIETFVHYIPDVLKNSIIDSYYISWNTPKEAIKKALNKGYDGISIPHHKISTVDIELANKKGLKVQVWTPKTNTQLESCLKLKPQYIQSDFF